MERIASATEQSRRELRRLRLAVEDLVTWVKRIGLAAVLWGASAYITLSSDNLADLIVALAKRGR